MKKLAAVLFLLIGIVFHSNAQGQGNRQRTPDERMKMQMERLSSTLNLTEDQKLKISVIYLNQAKSQDSIRAASGEGSDRQGMFQRFASIRAANDEKIMALLNVEQKKAYATYIQERISRGGQPFPKANN